MGQSQNRFFPEYGSDYKFSQLEESVLRFWDEGKIFERTLDPVRRPKTYSFYDGPPFATGLPHYGHLLAGTIKDIVPRYWTMRGYRVPRRFGWDCHGLPVEFEMEKTLGLSGSLAIQDYGVAKFNEACRGIVLRYTNEWKKTVRRIGRWIDMDNDYKTMDTPFMESVWWVFQQLWKKGLIYEGKKVVPYSWRLTAPLSNFEASLNYKSVQDPALTVLLTVKNPSQHGLPEGTALAIWTTTPWTLPSNLAVAAHPKSDHIQYGVYALETPVGPHRHVIVSTARAEAAGLSQLVQTIPNSQLLGLEYHPLFGVFDDAQRKQEKAFRILAADWVGAEDGTGLVHLAPAFGEDDFYLCQQHGIGVADPTDMQASFTVEIAQDPRLKDVQGVFVKDADKHIAKVLKDSGHILKQDVLQHNYPFCERSDTPLIYKAISSWFVKVDAIKDAMLAANDKIHWVPDHIQHGRFGKWLENARDWCISRNRFWGTPLPVWICSSCHHTEVLGSRAELETHAKKPCPDLHSHFIDEIHWDCPKCKTANAMKRTSEVLDCWFESGSMPYAQGHYPFENKEHFEANFPADFIAEGLDQTRGWFYTLTVLSTALFQKPAFQNCIVNGIVLAEDGKKMSKRLKNYPDPQGLFDTYGADAVRLYLMQSPAMHAQDLRFSERGLVELMRAVMLPLWNAYGFFSSYANIDGWTPESKLDPQSLRDIDRWILARTKQCEKDVHRSLSEYRLSEVAPHLISLIDDLTNWYIRLNRDRFWSENSGSHLADKQAAYHTLYRALHSIALLLAPGLPFLGELLFQALQGKHASAFHPELSSVHEHIFENPEHISLTVDEQRGIEQFRVAQKLILLGRGLRGEAKIGLRQPLPQLRVAGLSQAEVQDLESLRSLILKEVNVKSLEVVTSAADLVEESAKPNFKLVGKRLGKDMKTVQAALANWNSSEIAAHLKNGRSTVAGIVLEGPEIEIIRKAKPGKLASSDQGYVVELDTTISPELLREGVERELINRVQQRRKEMQLHLSDRIAITWNASPDSLIESIWTSAKPDSTLGHETLAVRIVRGSPQSAEEALEAHGSFSFDIQKT